VHADRGFRTGAEKIAKLAADNGFTLRQTVESISSPRPTPFAGSPETVADTIQEWFEGRALDGLSLLVDHPSQWKRFREDIVPILQDRDLVRTEYDSTTLRGNLGLPIPENRYTKARAEDESLLKI
jgi:alkanesulfonate monooxygenase SsuD/methylene tetrahydromethanopterin reductase-like flavin-dependent oxidoreductase (luciferase family)